MRKVSNILASVLAAMFLLFAVFQPVLATAGQWSNSGSTIYYNENGGKVGIGTSTPADPLQVYNPNYSSSDKVGKMMIGDDIGSWWIQGYNYNNNGTGYNHIVSNGYLYNGWHKRRQGYEMWMLSNAVTNGDGGDFSISHLAYNAGEGSNPTVFLKVNSTGTVYVRQLVVSNSWADFVFDKDYQLMPLADLSKYIEQNKHLPDIPTAEEVAKSGISVGDMQEKQMEKIEELTLYSIQQDKNYQDLSQKYSALENRLAKLESCN